MTRRLFLGLLFLLSATLLHGDMQYAVGASPGLMIPFSGDIQNFQATIAPGLDFRMTGFSPVVGLGISAGYGMIRGPYRDSLRKDSSAYTYRYLPISAYLLTDFSGLMTNPPVLPYFRIGGGPCYWDLRRDNDFLITGDSTPSHQWNYILQATIGAERRLGSLPLSVFLEATADYVASSDFVRYGPMDQDEAYAVVRLGLRYQFH